MLLLSLRSSRRSLAPCSRRPSSCCKLSTMTWSVVFSHNRDALSTFVGSRGTAYTISVKPASAKYSASARVLTVILDRLLFVCIKAPGILLCVLTCGRSSQPRDSALSSILLAFRLAIPTSMSTVGVVSLDRENGTGFDAVEVESALEHARRVKIRVIR